MSHLDYLSTLAIKLKLTIFQGNKNQPLNQQQQKLLSKQSLKSANPRQ